MEFTIEEIKALIGQLMIENMVLTRKLAEAQAQLAETTNQMKEYKQPEAKKNPG